MKIIVQKSHVLALTKRSYVADDFAHRRIGIVLAAASEFKIGNARYIFQVDGSPHSDYIARRCNMRDAFLSLRSVYITAPIIYLEPRENVLFPRWCSAAAGVSSREKQERAYRIAKHR